MRPVGGFLGFGTPGMSHTVLQAQAGMPRPGGWALPCSRRLRGSRRTRSNRRHRVCRSLVRSRADRRGRVSRRRRGRWRLAGSGLLGECCLRDTQQMEDRLGPRAPQQGLAPGKRPAASRLAEALLHAAADRRPFFWWPSNPLGRSSRLLRTPTPLGGRQLKAPMQGSHVFHVASPRHRSAMQGAHCRSVSVSRATQNRR